MKIAILGGAFDPPTKMHLMICEHALNFVDSVWMMPCYQSMFGKDMSSNQHRLQMCQIVCRKYTNITTSNFEINNEITGGTIYCVEKLIDTYHEDFYWIIGQDNANVFDKWHRYEELKSMIKFIVYPRFGSSFFSNSWYSKEPHIYCKDFISDNISSTIARELIRNQKDAISFVEEEVLDYIKENNLYI